MSEMKVHSSGGIVFKRTDEERKHSMMKKDVSKLHNELTKEIGDVKKLKDELTAELEKLRQKSDVNTNG